MMNKASVTNIQNKMVFKYLQLNNLNLKLSQEIEK